MDGSDFVKTNLLSQTDQIFICLILLNFGEKRYLAGFTLLNEAYMSLAKAIMKHTSTLGIRRQDLERYVLNRSMESVSTPYGDGHASDVIAAVIAQCFSLA